MEVVTNYALGNERVRVRVMVRVRVSVLLRDG